MNDNENNNINNSDNEDNTEKTSLPKQDEDTEYMLQFLAERKRERSAAQTQTIERPPEAQTEPEAETKPEEKFQAEQNQQKPRRFYNHDEREKKSQSAADRIAKLPIVPAILGAVVVVLTVALIVTLTNRNHHSDTEASDDTGEDEIITQISDNERYNVPDWITVDLLPVNKQSRPEIKLDAVNGAVVHYVANAGTTAEQNRSYFAGLANVRDVYASSNFIIGIDGEILMLVPPDEVAYCSNNRNYDTLSIECCHPDDTGEFAEATYQSLIKLLAWMCEEFDFEPEDIIRHYDITGKECPKDFVVNPEKWDQLLADVRAQIQS